MEAINKYILIMVLSILLAIKLPAVPEFDLDIQDTKINGPVSAVTTFRNNLITYDGSRWRIDDTHVLSKNHFDLNGKITEEWDFNNYEESNGQLIWEYNNKGLLDLRSYTINKQYISMVRFVYTDKGAIDEILKFASNGAVIGNSKYQYNTDGKLTSITDHDNAGTTTKLINYSYTKSGTKSCEETLWYGKDSARLIRLYDNNEFIYEAIGYKADKIIYHSYYKTDPNGVITAISKTFEADTTRYDISYINDAYGNWTRKTVIIYITRNGYSVPGESYMDTRALNYRIFTAYSAG
ncbi:MAG: hypothetical protein WCO98_08060 [bacterium]